jgi:hypothetical protein
MMPGDRETNISRLALPAAVVVLLCTTIFSLAYLMRQKSHIREMDAERDQMNAMLSQTRDQIQALTQKLDVLTAIQQQYANQQSPAQKSASEEYAKPPAQYARRRHTSTVTRRVAVRRPEEDNRWMILESRLSDQQKQIANTREEVDKARTDLQGKLDSTRDDLNGSIAKNHDELVQLQKRGERSYYEFTLSPSKQFQRVGPIGVSLHKVNFKHKYFDFSMMVDDIKLEKKHVNLYEPVWINLSDRPQPVELVVNRIDKNQVQGYLSEPKYKKSELAASSPAGSKAPALQTR